MGRGAEYGSTSVTSIEQWVRPVPTDTTGQLAREDVSLLDGLDGTEGVASLGHELRRNYISPEEIAVVLEAFGADRLATHLRANKLPTKVSIRHGEFGEALAGALFRRVKRYCVPIMKLRYKQGRNQPTHLADILAFRLRVDPPVVAVLEAKTRTTRDLAIGVEAYSQLQTTLRDGLGQAITFVAARLAERNPALATRILVLLNGACVIERHIVLVYDEAAWDEKVIQRLRPLVLEESTATIIRLARLRQLVASAYCAAEEDVSRVT